MHCHSCHLEIRLSGLRWVRLRRLAEQSGLQLSSQSVLCGLLGFSCTSLVDIQPIFIYILIFHILIDCTFIVHSSVINIINYFSNCWFLI